MTLHTERMQFKKDDSVCSIDLKLGLLQRLSLAGEEVLFSSEKKEELNFENSIPLFGNPVLFPFSGRSWNQYGNLGSWTYNEKELLMPRHGFFHTDITWKDVSEGDSDSIVLLGEPNSNAFAYFPFQFVIKQSFSLVESTIFKQCIEIQNKETIKSLPTSLGWHPFFKYRTLSSPPHLNHSAKKFSRVNQEGNINDNQESITSKEGFNLDQPLNHVLHELQENSFVVSNLIKNRKLKITWRTPSLTKQSCIVLWKNTKDPNYLCIEPWSSPPDAYRNKTFYSIPAQHTVSYELTIELQ